MKKLPGEQVIGFNQTLKTRQGDGRKRFLISLLVNGGLFFLRHALILIDDRNYRLLVIRDKQLLADHSYPTIRGAKIAFIRHFKEDACLEDIKAEWSPLYSPEPDWLDKILSNNI